MSLKKKILVSMLAVGLVLGPFALVGPNNTYFGSSVANAASFSEYASMLDGAYAKLTTDEKNDITTVKTAIAGVNWNTVLANPALHINLSAAFGVTKVDQFLTDLTSLFYLDSGSFESRLNSFKNSYSAQLETLFGNDYTFDQFTGFINNFARAAIAEGAGKVILGDITISDLQDAMVEALETAVGSDAEFSGKLSDIGTSLNGLLQIKTNLETAIDTAKGAGTVEKALKASFGGLARANSSVSFGTTVTSGQTYTLSYIVEFLGNTVETVPSGLNWYVVSPGIASVSGNKLTVSGTGTFALIAKMSDIIVFSETITATANTGGGGGGGTPSATAPTPTQSNVVPTTEKTGTNAAGQTTNTVSVKAEDVLKQAQNSKEAINLVLKASKDADVVSAALPSDLVNKLNVGNPNHAVTLETPAGSVKLPVAELSKVLANAAGQGIDAVNAQVNIVVEKVPEAARKALEEQLGLDSQALVGLVQTKLVITSGDKTYEVKVYTDYVTNTVIIDGIHNANQLVGVSYSGSQGSTSKEQTFTVAATSVGQASALPTLVEHENGKTVVTMMTRTNAPFTVVKTNKKFTDVSNQWFAADVTLLANKLLVNGISEGVYAPNNTLTRAEFATMIVRALGLPEDIAEGASFSDVMVTDWYAGAIGAAAKAGVIQGVGDNKFNPTGYVTRQEVAKMVVAAIKYAGGSVPAADKAALAKFSDADQVSSWAYDAVTDAASKGILKGVDGKVNPLGNASRAEAAAFIKRFMQDVKFITE